VTAATASVVAVDIGASSGRVLGARIGPDEIVLHEVFRFPNGPVERQGSLHWDFAHLARSVSRGLAAAAAAAPIIDSIGIDTWAVDYGLLDRDGALLGDPFCYRDGRTAGAPEVVAQTYDAGELYARNGTAPLPLQTIFQLVAERDGPHLAAAAQALLIPDLLNHWLTGASCCEITNASTTGLVDPARRRFDGPLMASLGIDPALFPDLIEPGTVMGTVQAGPDGDWDAAPRPAGVQVMAVASHDTASAVVAVPATTECFAFLSCGTWSIFGVELAAPVLSAESLAAGFSNELGVDATVRYVRNVAGLWLLQECQREWTAQGRAIAIGDLVDQAARAAPWRTLVDPDRPEFVAPGDMPTRLAGAARRSGQPEPRTAPELARCIFESLALAYRRHLRAVMDLTGRDVEVLHLVGGGARNGLLCQLTADACQRRVVAGPDEASAIGNALVQARRLVMPGAALADLRRLTATQVALRTYEPEGTDHPWAAAEGRLR
jgi:rhamnulokinase